jgi:hypothetical protein
MTGASRAYSVAVVVFSVDTVVSTAVAPSLVRLV